MNFIIILLCGIIGILIVDVYYLKKDVKQLKKDNYEFFCDLRSLAYKVESLEVVINENKNHKR